MSSRVDRRLERFTSADGTVDVAFPSAAFEHSGAQALRLAHSTVFGADYVHDHLAGGAAPKQPGRETVRFLLLPSDGNVPERLAALRSAAVRGARGRLWARVPDGSRHWAWARAVEKPRLEVSRLTAAGVAPVVMEFVRLSDWYAEAEAVAIGPVVSEDGAMLAVTGMPVTDAIRISGGAAQPYLLSLSPTGLWGLGEGSGDAIDLAGDHDGTVTAAEGQRRTDALDDGGDGALRFLEGTTNAFANPRLGTGSSGWSAGGGATNTGRIAVAGQHGDYSYEVNVTANMHAVHIQDHSAGAAQGTTHTVSAAIRAKAASDVGKVVQQYVTGAGGGDFEIFAQNHVLTADWQRVGITVTWAHSGHTGFFTAFRDATHQGAFDFYVTEVQYEPKPQATPYCDGSLGAGYAWTGTAHASSSTRVATSVDFGSPDSLDGIFTGGGAVACLFRLDASPSHIRPRLLYKGQWDLLIESDSLRLRFDRAFSGGTGRWVTSNGKVALGRPYALMLLYDDDDPSNDPTMRLVDLHAGTVERLTVGSGLTETSMPSGTPSSDAGSSLTSGYAGADRALTGVMDEVAVWKGAQPTEAQFRSYVAKACVFTEPVPGGYGVHEGDRLQVPVTGVLDPAQGAVAIRAIPSWASAAAPANFTTFFNWQTDNSNRALHLFYRSTSGQLEADRRAGGVAAGPAMIPAAWAAGEGITVIGALTPTHVRAAFNGSPFVESANPNVPDVSSTPLADLGTWVGTLPLGGNIRWVAMIGGDLDDSDSATLHAYGDTAPASLAALWAAMPGARPRLLWDAVSASYETACYVLNEGDASVHHPVVEVRREWAGLEVENLTTGELVSTTTPGVGPESVLRIDGARMAVEVSDDGGETFTDDYANATVPPTQVGLITLVPGLNVIVARSSGTPTASITVTYRAAFE